LCCTFSFFLSFFLSSIELQQRLLYEIMRASSMLIRDQFGNYVIQHVVSHGRPIHRDTIVGEVMNQVFVLSQHKFASNVVEKCLEHGTSMQRRELVAEVVRAQPNE
jgi:hypothetical protein